VSIQINRKEYYEYLQRHPVNNPDHIQIVSIGYATIKGLEAIYQKIEELEKTIKSQRGKNENI